MLVRIYVVADIRLLTLNPLLSEFLWWTFTTYTMHIYLLPYRSEFVVEFIKSLVSIVLLI